MLVWASKDPVENLDYSLDWSKEIGNDAITNSVWTADSGITLSNPSFSATGATTWISGGVDGKSYRIWNTITTTSGRIEKVMVSIAIITKQ